MSCYRCGRELIGPECLCVENNLLRDERDEALRERDEAQSGWLPCRVCGATGEVHTCDYCHASALRERDEARGVAIKMRTRWRNGRTYLETIDAEDCRDNPWLTKEEQR